MSCDVAVSAALLLASFHPASAANPSVIPIVAEAPPATNPLAREPLFARIVGEAESLNDAVERYRAAVKAGDGKALADLSKFQKRVGDLADLDMKGHLELAKRGTDGDLKCILKGIAQDLPKKLDELMTAKGAEAQEVALRDMFYLLRDNVEVITTPPSVQSTDKA